MKKLYLIKRIKWSKHYNLDTYWGPDENGYVSIIANAGFYTEEKAKNIVRLAGGNAEMVPVTKEIFRKAFSQTEQIREEIRENVKQENERHKKILEELDREDREAARQYARIVNILEELHLDED